VTTDVVARAPTRPSTLATFFGLIAATFVAIHIVFFLALVVQNAMCPETPHTRHDDARVSATILATLARVHREQHGRFPYDVSELEEIGFFENTPLDPWERPFRYWIVNDDPVFVSLGADGRCGGTGQDADVASDI
jgi:hypothetical protein